MWYNTPKNAMAPKRAALSVMMNFREQKKNRISVNKICKFWRWYININITILDTIHRPDFYLKLPAQQVNVIYRFVTMVY
jgi:hypothetical protein